tara:strand:+ start:862 stop:1839 length:978 start_codon:yes stop_codon:yes gene_type:complete
MKKILLTGGLGFIGSYFYEKYCSNYNFRIIDTNYFKGFDENQNIVYKDIRNINQNDLIDIDFVVHMAELSNDPLGDLDKNLTNKINHLATLDLLEIANRANIKKFIYMSSASVYGFSEKILKEKDKVSPLTEYSKAKVRNENYILNNKFNFETIILRNSTAFGFSKNLRLDLVVNDLTYSAFNENKIVLLSDGSPKRPIIHIHDICKFIDVLINEKRNLDKEIFNVGDESLNYSIREIAETVSSVLGVDDISIGKFDSDQRSYELSFVKLKEYFPEFKINFDLRKGILDLVENFKDYKIKGNERRVQLLNQLIKQKRLDENLKWS